MTEEEWLAAECSDPLLRFIEPRVSDRKLHYFAIACSRRISPLLVDPASQHAIDVLERFVEGQCGAEDILQLSWEVEGAAFAVESGYGVPWLHLAEQLPESLLAELVADPSYSIPSARSILISAAYFVDALFSPIPWERRFRNSCSGRSLFQPVSLVHEIFGNPFRTVKFRRRWRTDTVLALARQMYESRDFSAMPILADALQDAGCDSEDILSHCRDANAHHVRGCWVVDLVLGLS
jgi:hypothetical protein